MNKAEIVTMLETLAGEQQDDSTSERFIDDVLLRLSKLAAPPFVEAALVKPINGIATYNYRVDMSEILTMCFNDKQLFYADDLDLNADDDSWKVADSSDPTVYKTQDVPFYPEFIEEDAQSPDDSDTWWSQVRCTIDASGGLISSSDNASHYLDGGFLVPVEIGNKMRITLRVKAADKNWIRVALSQADSSGSWLDAGYIFFDVTNKAVGVSGSYGDNDPEGNIHETDADGYVKLTADFYIDYPGAAFAFCFLAIAEADNDYSFTGDGSTVDLYIKDISLQFVRDGLKAVDRNFVVYPKPSANGGSLIPTHGEPFGEDFPTDWFTVFYSQIREDDLDDYIALPIAIEALGREFEYPSDHQDVKYSQICEALSSFLYKMIGVQ